MVSNIHILQVCKCRAWDQQPLSFLVKITYTIKIKQEQSETAIYDCWPPVKNVVCTPLINETEELAHVN